MERSNGFASGMYRGMQVVAAYMHERAAPLIDGVLCKSDVGHRDACMKGLWLRTRAWVQTLERLNETKYVQAIATANRALLEITTDVILLHHDKSNESGWKLHWWGVSEKMKAAEQTVRFYEDQGLSVPDEYSDLETFYREEKQIVDDMRKTLWPVKDKPHKAEHPKRWTGKSDLSVDIERADELYGDAARDELGKGLVEYYRTEYRRMNWQVHSGTAGWWNMPPEVFDFAAGFALRWSADFAMLCTKIVLTDFGYTQVIDDLRREWDRVRENRQIAFYSETLDPDNK